MGVGLPKAGDSVITLNEQTTYQTWEFLYDPRIEQLKAQASLLGGPASTGAGVSGQRFRDEFSWNWGRPGAPGK